MAIKVGNEPIIPVTKAPAEFEKLTDGTWKPSMPTLDRWVACGMLEIVRIGSRRFTSRSAILKLIEESTQVAETA